MKDIRTEILIKAGQNRIWARLIPLARALFRARLPILSVAVTYAASILVGIVMVHLGNEFSISYRDKVVGNAFRTEGPATENSHGHRLHAAVLDFAGNFVQGSIPKAIMGMAIILPYPFVAYQGWIGGIVSVGADRRSRFGAFRSGVYYLLTIVLQILAYSLAIGAGVNVGVSLFRPGPHYIGKKVAWIFPQKALTDFLLIYALAVPIFFVASLWEFLSPWNF